MGKQYSFNFCVESQMFVDPSSLEPVELGTRSFPFKSLALPFKVLFHQSDKQRNYEILLKSFKNHYLESEFEPLIILD